MRTPAEWDVAKIMEFCSLSSRMKMDKAFGAKRIPAYEGDGCPLGFTHSLVKIYLPARAEAERPSAVQRCLQFGDGEVFFRADHEFPPLQPAPPPRRDMPAPPHDAPSLPAQPPANPGKIFITVYYDCESCPPGDTEAPVVWENTRLAVLESFFRTAQNSASNELKDLAQSYSHHPPRAHMNWYCMLPRTKNPRNAPTRQFVAAMRDLGADILENYGRKDDGTDNYIKEKMEQDKVLWEDIKDERKGSHLYVLVSSDLDFVGAVRGMNRSGMKMMVIGIEENFVDSRVLLSTECVSRRDWAMPNWNEKIAVAPPQPHWHS